MADIFLGLGSNIGDKRENLRQAALRLRTLGDIVGASSLYKTEPVGFAAQDWFLNAVLQFRTDLSPRDLLNGVLGIEREMGRVRTIKDGPRLIDIDVLLWGSETIDESGLSIPHPRLHERRFVLEPLTEIAPNFVHPKLDATVRQLRDALEDNSSVDRDGVFSL